MGVKKMFTGIIQKVERIKLQRSQVIIKNPFDSISLGESIAVNGICLTVDRIQNDFLFFSIGEETQKKTNIKYYHNKFVNLERSVAPHDLLGGHIVYGHVDGVIRLLNIRKNENTYWFKFSLPEERWGVIEKGSISLNGVSLTIARKGIDFFNVQIVKYTFTNTNFKFARIGDLINYEIDIVARYLKTFR